MDESTSLMTNGRFARIAVEVDTSRLLVPGMMAEFEGGKSTAFWQVFEYEHIHLYCLQCGRIGHRSQLCKFDLSSSISYDVHMLNSDEVPAASIDVGSPNTLANDGIPAPIAWIYRRR